MVLSFWLCGIGFEFGLCEVGGSGITFTKVGTGEIDVREIGIGEVCADKFGTDEVGIGEIGTSEVSADEIGTDEDRMSKIGTSEVSTGEIGTDEIGTGEIGITKVCFSEISVAEVDRCFLMPFSPRVPCFYTSLEKSGLFLICHAVFLFLYYFHCKGSGEKTNINLQKTVGWPDVFQVFTR